VRRDGPAYRAEVTQDINLVDLPDYRPRGILVVQYLGARSPQSRRITADRLTGSLTVRVGATGTDGAGSLEADGQGEVVRRTPAR
jgi:hypothetical protein